MDYIRIKNKMTVDEHIENANDFAIIHHYFDKIYNRCKKYYLPRSRYQLHQLLWQLTNENNFSENNIIEEIKFLLSRDFYRSVNDEQFNSLGNIYYKKRKDNE